MKAAVYSRYGPPDVLQIKHVEKPVPNDNEILIKIRAASVNPLDWHLLRGEPYIVRILFGGLRKPKDTRVGSNLAGQVEAVGRNVTQFKPGDEVFGASRGAFAKRASATVRRHKVETTSSRGRYSRPTAISHESPTLVLIGIFRGTP